MRYKCLALDYDDTVVRSTEELHFPSFKKVMKILRPDKEFTLEEFFLMSFDPGFLPYVREVLKLTDEELEYEQCEWIKDAAKTIPEFYEGMNDILTKFQSNGGIVTVVSHSMSHSIENNFNSNTTVKLDDVYGWDLGEGKRKPDVYPLKEIMRKFNLKPDEILMVDDLKPGYDMAKKCDVDFACAGWSHVVPKIVDFMKNNSDYYLTSVDQFRELVL